MLRYTVRLWLDPYNARGEYHEYVQHYSRKGAALAAAMGDSSYERAIVIDTFRKVSPESNANVVVYARGFQ